jgi:hypothetical protein
LALDLLGGHDGRRPVKSGGGRIPVAARGQWGDGEAKRHRSPSTSSSPQMLPPRAASRLQLTSPHGPEGRREARWTRRRLAL